MTISFGWFFNVIASRYPMIFFPSCFKAGNSLDLAPVAIIIFSPIMVFTDPSCLEIIMLLFSPNLPKPSNTLILFFFIKKFTPLLIVLATFLLLATTLSKFLSKFSTEIPYSSECFMYSKT